MEFKSAAIVEKSELKNNVEGLSLKRQSGYYVGTIKGYAMKTAKEEVFPFFSDGEEDFLVVTEDSHLWHYFQSKADNLKDSESEDVYRLDDFFEG